MATNRLTPHSRQNIKDQIAREVRKLEAHPSRSPSGSLHEIGQGLKKTNTQTNSSTRRYSENFPHTERLLDFLGYLLSYRFEFKNYRLGGRAFLTVEIQQEFDRTLLANNEKTPLTISETGLGVGFPGTAGAPDTWYPIAYLGDLDFAADEEYTVIFQIDTFGTGTQEYKVSFNLGDVDLTSVSTITASSVTVPITASSVISPPTTRIYNVYIYGLVTGFSPAGWVFYSSHTFFKDGAPYSPHIIAI